MLNTRIISFSSHSRLMYKLCVIIIISAWQVAKPRLIEIKEICQRSHKLLSGGVELQTRRCGSWAGLATAVDRASVSQGGRPEGRGVFRARWVSSRLGWVDVWLEKWVGAQFNLSGVLIAVSWNLILPSTHGGVLESFGGREYKDKKYFFRKTIESGNMETRYKDVSVAKAWRLQGWTRSGSPGREKRGQVWRGRTVLHVQRRQAVWEGTVDGCLRGVWVW